MRTHGSYGFSPRIIGGTCFWFRPPKLCVMFRNFVVRSSRAMSDCAISPSIVILRERAFAKRISGCYWSLDENTKVKERARSLRRRREKKSDDTERERDV